MGMSTHIIGIKAPDDHWKEMKAVWEACIKAKIDIPEEVQNFFQSDNPDEKGVVIRLDDRKGVGIIKWKAEMEDGYQVDIKKLLEAYPDLTHIRVYNSY